MVRPLQLNLSSNNPQLLKTISGTFPAVTRHNLLIKPQIKQLEPLVKQQTICSMSSQQMLPINPMLRIKTLPSTTSSLKALSL